MIYGVILCIALLVAVAVYSGRQARDRKTLGAGLVTGMMLGSFIGGSSTIGTAQLAYSYGMSVWCFHVGAICGLLFLMVVFLHKLRQENGRTIVGIIGQEYGPVAGLTASVLNALGTFIAIFAQLFSAVSVIAVVFPGLSPFVGVCLSAFLMGLYIIFGGTRSAGMVGLFKLSLLCLSMISSGVLVLYLCGGLEGFSRMVDELNAAGTMNFYALFNRGIGIDIGSGASLIIGISTTQIYALAMTSATTEKDARLGVLMSAAIVPFIASGGILVGLYMRAHYPDIAPSTALTQFVLTQMPEFFGGIVLATLFVAVLGSGAGICLGVSTIVYRDIVQRLRVFEGLRSRGEFVIRLLIVSLLVLAVVGTFFTRDGMILNYSVLSMALRGAVVFAPLLFALWLRGRVRNGFAMTAIVIGPILVAVLHVSGISPVNPIFVGVAVALMIMLVGLACGRKSVS